MIKIIGLESFNPRNPYDGRAIKLTLAVDGYAYTLYFSYSTLVAYCHPKADLIVSENIWSNTTGKHLNYINADKSQRISRDDFRDKAKEIGLNL